MSDKKFLIIPFLICFGCLCFGQSKEGDIKWINSNFGTLKIKIEPHNQSVMTPNLAMQFKNLFQNLRQNIDWLIPSEVNVEVYQNKNTFLRHNSSVAEDWSGAFFDPNRNIIVMYDQPKNQEKMFKKFAHELTHLFVENTFNHVNSKAPKKEPPVWLNEGLAVNMEDITKTPGGGVWNNDLIVINIFSDGEHKALIRRKKDGGLSKKEKIALRNFSVSDEVVFFKNFADFMEPDSYDIALQEGKVDDWYLQAYAMVRFLFRPGNGNNPAMRMKFKRFTELLSTYAPKRDEDGKIMYNSRGKKIMTRMTEEEALNEVYRYKSIYEFEKDFWDWITKYQAVERKKLR
ncbi:MAG: hypothetical protein K6E94_06640 [Elusimicrobiaceae bacterium]|nr:hypothetical protein [Elusimicrobiaceae bacterium]